jgi:hypothetical protein
MLYMLFTQQIRFYSKARQESMLITLSEDPVQFIFLFAMCGVVNFLIIKNLRKGTGA